MRTFSWIVTKTGLPTRFWAMWCGVPEWKIRKSFSEFGKCKLRKTPIKKRTGFSAAFWAAWCGVSKDTIGRLLTGKQRDIKRRKQDERWRVELSTQRSISVKALDRFTSREHYWQHIATCEEYYTDKVRWRQYETLILRTAIKQTDEFKERERKRHREWVAKCKKEKRPFILRKRVRHTISGRLRRKIKKGLTKSGFVDFDTQKTIAHIQSKFRAEMSWENWGKVWEIDHIIPLKRFDLHNLVQSKMANHWSNLQPLFTQENRSKGAKFVGPLESCLK
jgi:hypothetical protein